MKIFILEPTGATLSAYQKQLASHEIVEIDSRGWRDAKLLEAIHDADIVVLTNRPLSKYVISNMPNLKFIAVAFAGIDHVDAETILARNITVKNAAGYANTAVAELVMGLMISLARRIPENNAEVRHGALTNSGTQLKDKILGIVGMGAIGKEVARLAAAFQMQILAYDRKSLLTLETLFSQSDYVSLHIPLLETTNGIINLELLSKMKATAYLINCARGPIINEQDLSVALKQGMLAGAALDVFDVEPPIPGSHILLQAPNVIATPHIGFNTVEAVAAKGQMALDNVVEFICENLM